MALTLYHSPSSVCSAKVRVVLAEKKIPWQSQIVDIFRGEQFAPAYLKLNPAGVVPTLVHDGRAVRESLVICEYLEEAYPRPALTPPSHVARARMRVWCKDVETFMVSASVGMIFSRDRPLRGWQTGGGQPCILLRAPSEPQACRAQAAMGPERIYRSGRALCDPHLSQVSAKDGRPARQDELACWR